MEELWAYMKAKVPELSISAIPQEGENLCHADLHLAMEQPQVRDISWNPQFLGRRFSAKYAKNILALVIYLTGKQAEEKCGRCGKSAGPFQGCILPVACV